MVNVSAASSTPPRSTPDKAERDDIFNGTLTVTAIVIWVRDLVPELSDPSVGDRLPGCSSSTL
jgi:hypothetical protein